LFLGKSTKTAATSAARFDSNMHQIVYRLGFAPDATGGAYSAHPDHLAVFRGPTCKGTGREKEGSGKGERGGEERKERGGERRGERGEFVLCPGNLKKEKLAPVAVT